MQVQRSSIWIRLLRILVVGAILYASWLMLRLTWPYTALRPGIDFLKTKAFIYHILHWRLSFYIHVFTGILALLTGLTQFSGYIIRQLPKLHRISGYLYVVNVLAVTGPAALVMSFYANGGWPARSSFILQSLAWLFCTGIALSKAFRKKFQAHGAWMLRSYALTLAAITLRTYAAILSYTHSGLHPVEKYILIAWASWIPNLLIAEWLIRSGFIRSLFKKSKRTYNVPG